MLLQKRQFCIITLLCELRFSANGPYLTSPIASTSEAYPALGYFYHASYRGEPVRIAALYQPVYDDSMRGIALIQVGESQEARRDLSRKILFDTLWRQAALVFAAALLVWFAVRIVLRPVMRPLVTAMNGYMARLQALITGQRRFIADASHQLRTPLTVLKTQAELALRENDPRAMREIVESMARTTDATVHLANRLLTLARAEHGAAEGEMQAVSLVDIVRQVGLELAQEAVKKGIDLSLDASQDVTVHVNALSLHELITNLVDNAIRYTPSGGRVALRVSNDMQSVLEVEDSGPGITAVERRRVFSPFYRGASAQTVNAAGVGLTILRDIVASHKADIKLSDSRNGGGLSGLRVEVRFPVA